MRDVLLKIAKLNSVMLECDGIVYSGAYIHPDYPPAIELESANGSRIMPRVKSISRQNQQLVVEDRFGRHVFNILPRSAPHNDRMY